MAIVYNVHVIKAIAFTFMALFIIPVKLPVEPEMQSSLNSAITRLYILNSFTMILHSKTLCLKVNYCAYS